MNINEKKKTKKISFLTEVSILLFLIGVLCFVLGIIYAFDVVTDNATKMLYDDFEDMFKISDFQQVAMCFFTGFVFFVWAGVLFIISRISNARKQRELEQVESEQKETEIEEEVKTICCAYCGSELETKDKKCPHCGSSKKVLK